MPLPAAAQAEINAKYQQLLKIRPSKEAALKPTPLLRTELKPGVPLKLRPYQTIGIFHLLVMPRMILGDGTGLGKTLQAVATFCYLWHKEPDNRVMVVSPKAAQRQWESEILRFTTGVKVYVVTGDPKEREAVYQAWKAHTGPDKPLLLVTYSQIMRDWAAGSKMIREKGKKPVYVPGLLDKLLADVPDLVTVFDEATAFKNTATKTWATVEVISKRSKRAYGLTATLLKNNLVEGYSIYKALVPWLFPTKKWFYDTFCTVREQVMPGGRRIPLVVGYKNLALFRQMIDPYFLGRPKSVVSAELPVLTTRRVTTTLSPAEAAKYREALSGVLELGDGTVKDYEESKALTALIYCQLVVDSLTLLRFKEADAIEAGVLRDEVLTVKSLGAKEQLLVDLITEELDGEKVIIYTRFESLVARLQAVLKAAGVKSTRITGKEKAEVRKANQDAFQDEESDTKVIFITDAGSEAINLQTASALLFYDAPWSWGAYIQTLGRPQRLGSKHTRVLVYHLVAEMPGETAKEKKTIDDYVLETLDEKKTVIDQVLGETAVGALTFEDKGSSAKDLVRRMQTGGKARG